MPTPAQARIRRIGPDEITVSGDLVIIDAAREMPDWEVREFCRPAIYFRDRRYFLLRRARSRGQRMRYELKPWADDENPVRTITYDDQYVQEREQSAHGNRRAEVTGALLIPLYPIIGWAPSCSKAWLAEKYGVNAQNATRASLALEAILVLAYFAYWNFTGALVTLILFSASVQLGSWTPAAAAAHLGGMLFVAWDCVVRWDQLLRDVENPCGLFEWIFRRTGAGIR